MIKALLRFFTISAALVLIAGCNAGKVPGWATGKWTVTGWADGVLNFEISQEGVSMDGFGSDTKMPWNDKKQIEPLKGVKTTSNANIISSSEKEFAFRISAQTEIVGISKTSDVDFLLTKDEGNENTFTLTSQGRSYKVRKR